MFCRKVEDTEGLQMKEWMGGRVECLPSRTGGGYEPDASHWPLPEGCRVSTDMCRHSIGALKSDVL
jgi:hypothetical protein